MIIDALQKMSEEMAAVRREDFETDEDYFAELKRIEDYWIKRINLQKDELNKAVNNNKILYDQDWNNYHIATGYKISDTDKFVTNFSDSILSSIMNAESTDALMSIINSATTNLVESLFEASKNFSKKTEEVMNEAGTSIKTFADDINKASENISVASKKIAQDIE
jgi:hypothetical protein